MEDREEGGGETSGERERRQARWRLTGEDSASSGVVGRLRNCSTVGHESTFCGLLFCGLVSSC